MPHTPLVINSLGGGHTHTHIQTFVDRSNSKKPGAPAHAWFKNMPIFICRYTLPSQAQSQLIIDS